VSHEERQIMTDNIPSVPPTGDPAGQHDSQSTIDSTREQASEIKDQAVEAGGHLAETSKARASDVVEEAKFQAQDLLDQTREELREQAEHQQRRVADGLRAVSDEFSRMAQDSDNGGIATELVQNAAVRSGTMADWLGERDPGSLLDEVRRFASRKPGTFIAIAAATGILAGRLTRSIASNASAESGASAHTRASGTSRPTTSVPASSPSGATGSPATGTAGTATPVYSSLAADEYGSTADQSAQANPATGTPRGNAEQLFNEEGR
jgi:polyhydroxyalkanoate synthesis regulator phasin